MGKYESLGPIIIQNKSENLGIAVVLFARERTQETSSIAEICLN